MPGPRIRMHRITILILIQPEKLDLVFIQETKCKIHSMYKFTKIIWGGCDFSIGGLRGF